eukprot:CAMPEP_0116901288 /NCGR_PEP_ID=MMETSP0467-20121206/9255_1 /TAXON_ID=283647 /ORGANISM="Mesodinium pulex, Strain SPMC105" /LENGTH=71 /DNA_ID=CAMNT_0004574755 /DNA_START=122 /DNA_END=337 /DNA_ORIENTATION=-
MKKQLKRKLDKKAELVQQKFSHAEMFNLGMFGSRPSAKGGKPLAPQNESEVASINNSAYNSCCQSVLYSKK